MMSGPATRLGVVTLGDLNADQLLALARVADESGFDVIWLSDEPFYRGAIPAAAACAVATQRLHIGVGVVNPYEHPPVVLARDFAMVQELARGRAVLGIGAGWQPPVESQGLSFGKPLGAVRDTIAIVRALLGGDRSDHDGPNFRTHSVQLSFEKSRTSTEIYVASMFPRSLEQAGAIADGVLLSILCPRGYVRAAADLVTKGAESVGRDPRDVEVVQYLLFHCDADRDSAITVMKGELARFIRHSYDPDPSHWAKVAELGGFDLDEFAHISRELRDGVPPNEAVEDGFVGRFSVAGSPRDCIEGLSSFAAAGMDQAGLLFCSQADAVEQLRIVGAAVLPQLRGDFSY